MAPARPASGHSDHRRTPPAVLITDARAAASADRSRRQRNYYIAMGFRVVCFVAIIFVQGWLRWVLLAAAVLLPYFAVTIANQANRRTPVATPIPPGAPSDAPQLPVAESDIIRGESDDPPNRSGER